MLRLGNTNGLGPGPPPMTINQENININGNVLGQNQQQYQDQIGSFQQNLQSVKRKYLNGQLKTQRNGIPKYRRRPYPYHIHQNKKDKLQEPDKTLVSQQNYQVVYLI